MEIMNPENPRWGEFVGRLAGEEGINFNDDFFDCGVEPTWECSSKKDRPYAISIMWRMGNIDIGKSLKYFDEQGGHCDCEILFNVHKGDLEF